jgi:hypothetical protein
LSKNNGSAPDRFNRRGHIRKVLVSDIRLDPRFQREAKPGKAAKIAAEFDPDAFGIPILTHRRDGSYYCNDGNHRVCALRDYLGWGDQLIECWVIEADDTDEHVEGDLFLKLNDRTAVTAFDKFRVAVAAQWPVEEDINRIVLACGLKVARQAEGGIAAVTALRKVYAAGPAVLAKTLRIASSAWGDPGLDGDVIAGLGLVVARHFELIDQQAAITKLANHRGSVGAVMAKATLTRKSLGVPLAQAVAAVIVEVLNTGKGGKKLPGWWS